MSDITIKRLPTQVYIGAFQGSETAGEIERLVSSEEWDSKEVICTNMAVAKCDIAGKTRIREMGSPEVLEAAAYGAITGGLLGSMSRLMIGSDKVVAKAAKAVKQERRTSALAKVAVKQIEGMDKDRLEKLGGALKPNSSAIVLIFDEVLVKKSDYESKMQEEKDQSDVMSEVITSKIQKYLLEGKDIAYHLMMEDGKIMATRTVEGKDSMQVRDIVLGQGSFSVDQVTATAKGVTTDKVVVTPEAVATARTALTSSLVAYEISVDDEEGFLYEAGHTHVTPNSIEASSEKVAITDTSAEYESEQVSVSVETKQIK